MSGLTRARPVRARRVCAASRGRFSSAQGARRPSPRKAPAPRPSPHAAGGLGAGPRSTPVPRARRRGILKSPLPSVLRLFPETRAPFGAIGFPARANGAANSQAASARAPAASTSLNPTGAQPPAVSGLTPPARCARRVRGLTRLHRRVQSSLPPKRSGAPVRASPRGRWAARQISLTARLCGTVRGLMRQGAAARSVRSLTRRRRGACL